MSSQADDSNGAGSEFAEAELGDGRRTQRLGALASGLAQHPTAARPAAWGDDAMLNAAYRFLDHDASAPQDVLLSHIEATSGRLAQVPGVLAVQETTAGPWTAHPATTGLGPLGPPACPGLRVQSPLAFTPARVPLGLVAQQVGARDPDDVGTRARRKHLPISQKESQKGRTSLDAVCRAREACPQPGFVSLGARAADGYDLRATPRPAGGALLLRAAWDRGVRAPPRSVWATVEAPPVVAPLRLPGPRRGAQPARDATLALRFCPLPRCAPRQRKAEGLPEVALWAVPVREVTPPAAGPPSEWLLGTTVAVDRVEDACERVHWDSGRWGSEVWHRMLHSGWRLAARQWATDARLERCWTLSSVMAWRGC